MWEYHRYPTSDELYHHGIKGQKWGVKNGPPYPIGSSSSSDYTINKSQIGKTYKDIDKKMIASINGHNKGVQGEKTNCIGCSTAYILNSLYGQNTRAKPILKGPRLYTINKMFSNVDSKSFSARHGDFINCTREIPRKSTGMIIVKTCFGDKHAMIYEKDKYGRTTIIDCQKNKIYYVDKQFKKLDNAFLPERYLDFSDSRLKNNYLVFADKLIEEKVSI